MGWTVITPPAAEPVSVEEAQRHLLEIRDARVEEIGRAITTARQHIETVCERAIMPQVWRLSLDAFPSGRPIYLPGGVVRAVSQIQVMDNAGAYVTVAPELYDVDLGGRPPRVRTRSSWPSLPSGRYNTVQLDLAVGWPDAASVPRPIIESILLLVADALENRQAQQSETLTVNTMLDEYLRPYRSITP